MKLNFTNLLRQKEFVTWFLGSLMLIFLSFSTFAGPRSSPYPYWLYNDYLWQKEQAIHLQTQQQLQSQDQYRRQLLLQDQQWQLQRLQDNQERMDIRQQNANMREHAERLRMYSKPLKSAPEPVKNKTGK